MNPVAKKCIEQASLKEICFVFNYVIHSKLAECENGEPTIVELSYLSITIFYQLYSELF